MSPQVNPEQLVRDVARDLMARLEYARPILVQHGTGNSLVALDELWASLGNEISERAPWSEPRRKPLNAGRQYAPPVPAPENTAPVSHGEFDTIEELED